MALKKCHRVVFFTFFLWIILLREFFLFQIVERWAENRFIVCNLTSDLESSPKKCGHNRLNSCVLTINLVKVLETIALKSVIKSFFFLFFCGEYIFGNFFLFHIVALWAKNVVFVCISTSELESSQKKGVQNRLIFCILSH